MALLGALLKNRRAGAAHLAWNLPNLAGPESLALTSAAFGDGEPIPAAYAGKRAGGRNLSPQLAWSPPPEGTAQLLLVVEDPDAPTPKPFVHCVALIGPGRPAGAEAEAEADGALAEGTLAEGALAQSGPAAGVQVLRSGMGSGYAGPEPIRGHGPHHYVFQLFALAEPLTRTAGGAALERARPRAVTASVPGPVLARGKLTGLYER
ncbi:MAG TPA: YbhB/YbcL family Raf kinase inhibitor-like protein [Actinocrinis sp.]